MNRFRPVVASLLAVGCLLALGCKSQEPHVYKGRVDPDTTTRPEIAESEIQLTALIEASDLVAQEFARDLAVMEEVVALNAQGQRATVLMGDINNKTNLIGSDEFEMVRSRIRNTLLQSGYVKDKVQFVERRARIGRIAEEELGPQPDGGSVAPPSFDRNSSFVMNGDFFRLQRDRVNQYYMEFQLVSFRTNTIVFSKRYEVKQVRVRVENQ